LVLAFILLGLFVFRLQILMVFGNFLICEDELEPVEVAFVLGGNSQIRAQRAAEVYDLNISDYFICTGEHHNDLSDFFDIPESEAALSRGFLSQMGVPSQKIEIMKAGTSTREEAGHILEKCIEMDWNKIALISDRFHTRRIDEIFRSKFKKKGVDIIIIGVQNDKYDEEVFWQNESGTVMVIMEYIKLIHYYFT